MPRTLQDLEFMKKDTGALKETVDVVRLQLSAADARTSDVIATLRQLDLVKDRMDTSLRVIREADNWNSLAAEIDSVLVSGDVQRAVERLREMERSLELMQRLPEYGQRKEQLTRAQNKFYASLSPQLVSAFAEQDMERCVSLYAVFKESRKESDFLDYYIKVRREPVVRQWAASHTAGGADAQATPARVTSLLEAIMDLTTNETAWCREVFSDPSRVTAMLAANIIGVLDPPLPSLLKECPLVRALFVFLFFLRMARSLSCQSAGRPCSSTRRAWRVSSASARRAPLRPWSVTSLFFSSHLRTTHPFYIPRSPVRQ